ncbi:MAG: hypothetical protein K2Q26_14520 [Bdellovibrionales bacterium]|nr:hypothetical protein [Bdellovibrionales bacterium]
MSPTMFLITIFTSVYGDSSKFIRCYATDEHRITHVVDFLSKGENKVEGIEKVLVKDVWSDQAVDLRDMATLKSPLIRSDELDHLTLKPYMTHIKITHQGPHQKGEEKWVHGNTICYYKF